MMHVTGQAESLLVAEQLQKIATQAMKSRLACTNPGQIRPETWTRTRTQFCSIPSGLRASVEIELPERSS